MERNELMLCNCANRISAVPFQSIRLSDPGRLSLLGRCRETRTALRLFAPSLTINSVRSFPVDFRRPSSRVVRVQVEIRFELRDCRPSSRGV
jgi:hypothetical protein